MKIRRKHIVIILAVGLILSLPVYATIARHRRVQQFNAVGAQIAQCGGSLGWELVDGNYRVDLLSNAAADEPIKAISALLRDLPTGFTLIGPGESRLLHIVLDSSDVTDDGFASLLRLRVEFLFLDGGTITDHTAKLIADHQSLSWLNLVDVTVSEYAIRLIQERNPKLNITTDNKAN